MSDGERAPHLCMVALTAYPVLAGRRDLRELGGAQVQQVMTARALVQAGARVSFVCMDYGQAEEEVIDGIRVVRSFAPEAGWRGVRFFHPRWSGLRAALRRADAPVYYQRCAGMATGLVAHWCGQTGRRFIYAGASDLDFQPGPPNVRGRRDRWLFTRGLRAADAVVVQNPRQLAALRALHGREGVLIPSCYFAPAPAAAQPPSAVGNGSTVVAEGAEVLWVGMIRRVKRPDRFLALARALPHLRFRMIGGLMGDSDEVLAYYRDIEAAARSLPNLTFMGFVPFADVEPWFDRAAVLVNTSDHEGFPNTFLQVWARGVPSLALFDTGSRLDGAAPYALAADDGDLLDQLRTLMDSPTRRRALGRLGRRFYDEQHAPAVTARRYLELLDKLARDDGHRC